MEKIVLVGFGGHARSIADSIECGDQYCIEGYTDLEETAESKYTYLGTDDNLAKIYESGIHKAAIGIGQIDSSEKRQLIFDRLKQIGYEIPTIVDPSAVISRDVLIGEGSFVGKGAIINSGVTIGKGCIVNTGALCEHDNVIGDFSHIAVRAVCCGGVSIGKGCLVGANSTIIQGITIGNNAKIGAGAVVTKDVVSNVTVVGIPASEVESR